MIQQSLDLCLWPTVGIKCPILTHNGQALYFSASALSYSAAVPAWSPTPSHWHDSWAGTCTTEREGFSTASCLLYPHLLLNWRFYKSKQRLKVLGNVGLGATCGNHGQHHGTCASKSFKPCSAWLSMPVVPRISVIVDVDGRGCCHAKVSAKGDPDAFEPCWDRDKWYIFIKLSN